MKNLLPCGIVVWALAGGLVGCRAPADQSASARVPHGLTVEYRENPCGLDAPAPRLGWKLAADGRDVMQAAWRVLAATFGCVRTFSVPGAQGPSPPSIRSEAKSHTHSFPSPQMRFLCVRNLISEEIDMIHRTTTGIIDNLNFIV